jgi:hypothetical protein
MTVRPKKDLIEVFGYAPDDLTPQCRSLWRLSACPFINKQCTKSNHDGSIIYGTCSVTSAYGDCFICPNRLYERNYATLRGISHEVFGRNLDFYMYEEFIPHREKNKSCIVALGQNSGKEVKIGTNLSIKNMNKQTPQIPSSGHGMNWANVHKRLIPQIIRKGIIYSRSSLVKSGLYFVVPDIVYRKFEGIIGSDIPLLSNAGKDVLTIHTYELSSEVKHGEQRTLALKRNIRFSEVGFIDLSSIIKVSNFSHYKV